MLRRNHLLFCCAIMFLNGWHPSVANAQFADLINRVPRKANTVILLNVDKIHQSPLAKKENWRERHEQRFSSGLIMVPPGARQFVMASRLDFEVMQPIWEAAVMKLGYEPDLPKVAAELEGQIDKVADRDTVALPGDISLVKFSPRIAGLMTPAYRQDVAQWIREVYSTKRYPLDEYLAEAVKFADQGAPIIIAMSLQDVFSPTLIREKLDEMKTLEGKKVDLDQLARVLGSIEGISLGITIGERRFGKIKVDFIEDVTVMKDFAKPLLLEILGRNGAMIDEFADWKPGVSTNQVTLEGTLYESGLRRVLSLLDAPPSLRSKKQAAKSIDPKQASESLMLVSSQQYFKSVASLLDDLQSRRKSSEVVTWGQVGVWFEKYARKIDRLPISNVDPYLIDSGAYVANQLRLAESAMKGVGAESRLRSLEVPNYRSYQVRTQVHGIVGGGRNYWGGRNRGGGIYGSYSWRSKEDLSRRGQEKSKIRTQEKIQGNKTANEIMQGLEQFMAEVRRNMTKQYSAEFTF